MKAELEPIKCKLLCGSGHKAFPTDACCPPSASLGFFWRIDSTALPWLGCFKYLIFMALPSLTNLYIPPDSRLLFRFRLLSDSRTSVPVPPGTVCRICMSVFGNYYMISNHRGV